MKFQTSTDANLPRNDFGIIWTALWRHIVHFDFVIDRICRGVIAEAINRILTGVETSLAEFYLSVNLELFPFFILKIAAGKVAIKAFVSNL